MPETCLEVLRRWVPEIKESELFFPSNTTLKHPVSLRRPSIKDVLVGGSLSSMRKASSKLMHASNIPDPSGVSDQDTLSLLFLAEFFSFQESLYLENFKSFQDPSPDTYDDVRLEHLIPAYSWISPSGPLGPKLTKWGYSPESIYDAHEKQMIQEHANLLRKILDDVYLIPSLGPGERSVYVKVDALTSFQERVLTHFYPCFGDQANTPRVFELPLSILKGLDTESLSPQAFTKHLQVLAKEGLEIARFTPKGLREKPAGPLFNLPFALEVMAVPKLEAAKKAEFDETLKSLSKTNPFLRAIELSLALTLST